MLLNKSLVPSCQVTRPQVTCRLAPRLGVHCSSMPEDVQMMNDGPKMSPQGLMDDISNGAAMEGPAQHSQVKPCITPEATALLLHGVTYIPPATTPPTVWLDAQAAALQNLLEAVAQGIANSNAEKDIAYVWNSLSNITQLKKWCKASQYDVPGRSYYMARDLVGAKWQITQWIADTTGCARNLVSHPAVDLEFLASNPSLELLQAWCAQRGTRGQGRGVYTGLPAYSKWQESGRAAALAKIKKIVQSKHAGTQAASSSDAVDVSIPGPADAHLAVVGSDAQRVGWLRDPAHVQALYNLGVAAAEGHNTCDAKRNIAHVWGQTTNLSQLKAFCKEAGYTLPTYYRAADYEYAKWDVTHWIAESTELIPELCRTPQSDLAYLQHLRTIPDAGQSIRLLKAWCSQQGVYNYLGLPAYSKWQAEDLDAALDKVIPAVQRALPHAGLVDMVLNDEDEAEEGEAWEEEAQADAMVIDGTSDAGIPSLDASIDSCGPLAMKLPEADAGWGAQAGSTPHEQLDLQLTNMISVSIKEEDEEKEEEIVAEASKAQVVNRDQWVGSWLVASMGRYMEFHQQLARSSRYRSGLRDEQAAENDHLPVAISCAPAMPNVVAEVRSCMVAMQAVMAKLEGVVAGMSDLNVEVQRMVDEMEEL